MAKNFLAYPELRHPFEPRPIHEPGHSTVLYQGQRIQLSKTGPGDDLLIYPQDLPRINGFTLKPEGACFEAMCVPLTDGMLVENDGEQWFNLTAFADHMGQPYVADHNARVWSFAEMPARRAALLEDGMAPDLTLTDRAGKQFRLADLKGKKALIVTWSSW